MWFRFTSCLLVLAATVEGTARAETAAQIPAPLFVDSHYRGSCDPEIVWNEAAREWWVFYTARRATRTRGTYVGTPIGIAASADLTHWRWVGYCSFDGTAGHADNPDTRWAPGILRDGDAYHMLATYKDNARGPWGGPGRLVHYLAPADDLQHGWRRVGAPDLGAPDPIDASLLRVGDELRIYYRLGGNQGLHWAVSRDGRTWRQRGACPGDVNNSDVHGWRYQEAPYAFRFADAYWLLTDPHDGLGVYRSDDAITWRFQGRILKAPGRRDQDNSRARHPSVAVAGDRAFVVYHVEPNRPYPTPPPAQRTPAQKQSVLQLAELRVVDGALQCDRDEPIALPVPPPASPSSSVETDAD